MKKIIAFLLLCHSYFCLHAVEFTYNGLNYSILSEEDKTCEVARNTNVSGDIVIPAIVEFNGTEYSVSAIRGKAFSGCSTLTSVDIPNSVTTIGYNAFSVCSSLSSVDIPNSVYSIGEWAFTRCSSLTSIDIPYSVTSIGDGAFSYCSTLMEINVSSENIFFSSISGAVYNKKITELLIVPGGYQGNFSIPKSVTSIGKRAFSNCSSLSSVDIPNSVTLIGEWAFSGCSALTSVDIPNSVKSIGYRTFAECPALTSAYIPNSVTSIGGEAFSGCSALTSVHISNSVTSISGRTFHDCSVLTSVDIPNSVSSIGNGAFEGCSSLTSVDIPNSVTSIEDFAFSDCSALTSVEIPISVTSIGEWTFSCCSALTSVEVPISVTSIERGVFSQCSSLTSIDIPNSVTSIGEFAFTECSSLTSVDIPNSVALIDEWAFSGCSALSLVAIPNSVTSIKYGAFFRCLSLTSVDIPNSVTLIENNAFSNCLSLNSVDIPNSVTSIGNSAFFDCSSLTSVVIPYSVTSIGSLVFYGCPKLSEVYCFIVEPISIGRNVFALETIYQGTLHVPVGTKEAYEAAEVWREFVNIVDDLVDGEEEGPTISQSEIVIATEEVFQLGVKDYEGDISWSSSNPSVAYVNECGLVVAMGVEGSATITASTDEEEFTCSVSVIGTFGGFFGDDPELLKPEKIEIESLCTNPPMLNVRLEPVGACTTIDWRSSDESIATVDRGFVAAYAVGTVALSSETRNGLVASIIISTDGLPLGVGDIMVDGKAPGSNDVYDNMGRCTFPHATREQINALSPGLYFINGKKLIVK